MIHNALHQFAHHPINRKSWYWKKRRCWQQEEIGNVIEIPVLPDADEKQHHCNNCREPVPIRLGNNQNIGDEPDIPINLKQLNWTNIKTMYNENGNKQCYSIKIPNISTEVWEEYLKPILNSNRRYLKLKQAMLISPEHSNHQNQCFALIKGKSQTKLAKVLKPLYEQRVLKQENEITPTNTTEMQKYNKIQGKRNRVVITGCKTLEQCRQCERYINTLKPKEGFFNWYKHKTNGEWIFEITLQHKLAKDAFIHKWIQGKREAPNYNHLNIYTKDANYHKTQQRKTQQQAMRQLHKKLLSIINDTEMPQDLSKELIQELTKLIPEYILKGADRMEIPEENMDFMHIYNIAKTNTSIETTKQDKRILTQLEKLRILSRNIGGKLKRKLSTKHNFMKQIITFAPHIILIQEHQLSKVRLREFRKMMTIKGYQLVNYSQSIKTFKKGRGSGGLATWIKTTVLNEYNYNTLENTAYVQTTKLTPIQPHVNPPIVITNTYCKPLCGRRQITKHLERIQDLHNTNDKQIDIILGDLNARTLTTGDHNKNAEGEGLKQFISKYKLHILNESLAHQQYTSINNNNGASIIDIAIVPQEQKGQWDTLEVIQTPRLPNTAAHNTIIATSYSTIQTTRVPNSYKYTINYNDYDAYCLRQQCKNKATKIQTTILNKVKETIPQENTPYTTKIMGTIQYCRYGIHHLTSLKLF